MSRIVVPALEDILQTPFQVLDKGEIRVLEYLGTDSTIVNAARVSYGKGTRTVNDDQTLINYLLRNRHTSPFEMCEILLYIKLPIFVAAQWIRHRTANINSYSARYSEMLDQFYIPQPEHVKTQDKVNKQGSDQPLPPEIASRIVEQLSEHSDRSYKLYQSLLDSGLSREQARVVLPQNVYTYWYWKIDLHNLMHFLALRASDHAQYEIREYAEIILHKIVAKWVPLTYEAFCKHRLNSVSISSTGKQVIKDRLQNTIKEREDYKTSEHTNIGKQEWNELMDLLRIM